MLRRVGAIGHRERVTKPLSWAIAALLAGCAADDGGGAVVDIPDTAPTDVIFGDAGADTRDATPEVDTRDSREPDDLGPGSDDDTEPDPSPELPDLIDDGDAVEADAPDGAGDTAGGDIASPDTGPDETAEPEVVVPFCGDGRCDPDEACPGCADCPCPARCGSDLFISEYLEGTSWNKALEIANFTGHDVELAGHALWKITNGGSWSEAVPKALPLTGVVASGAVLVVCHEDALADVRAACDLAVSVDALEFNGDDAIALTRNGAIIDVIGTDGADPGVG